MHDSKAVIASIVRGSQLVVLAIFFAVLISSNTVLAQSALAPNFVKLPPNATVVVMPTDIELYSISAGGIIEPKADWTAAANNHFKTALNHKIDALEIKHIELSENDVDEFSEINDLHGAVAQSINLHHFGQSFFKLPTKAGDLEWSMGDSIAVIKQKTGADYALFSWVRDSYASSERVAAMILMALLGIGLPGGAQVGYASLVDLNDGHIVWFGRMFRGVGDLREEQKAAEALNVLFEKFPSTK